MTLIHTERKIALFSTPIGIQYTYNAKHVRIKLCCKLE